MKLQKYGTFARPSIRHIRYFLQETLYATVQRAASGAWFTYVAAVVTSRQQTYEGILNLIEGLQAELALVSEWAAGDEGNQGYLSKTPGPTCQ